jgi:hypothetical protein
VPAQTKHGPSPKPVKLDVVETLASMGCTLEEIGAVIGLSKRQIIRREKSADFQEAMDRGRAKGRATLRRLQWTSANAGNVTAQIWLGKQFLGQRSFENAEKDGAAMKIPPLIIQAYEDPPSVAVEPQSADGVTKG